MEIGMKDDLDQLIYLDHARRTAEATSTENPFDPENLTRWGSVLLSLSHFKSSADSKIMIEDAIKKLNDSLMVDPHRPDTWRCLGNAELLFLTTIEDNMDEARIRVRRAIDYYDHAYELDSDNRAFDFEEEEDWANPFYKRVRAEAREVYYQLERYAKEQAMGPGGGPSTSSSVKYHGIQQDTGPEAGGGPSTSSSVKGQKTEKRKDLKYDILGWAIVGVTIMAYARARSTVPSPPP